MKIRKDWGMVGTVRCQRQAFTLVEILIVVSILGILAGVVVPQVSDASDETKAMTLNTDIQLLRKQIELYKLQHSGRGPHLNQRGRNNVRNLVRRLTERTDPDGRLTTIGSYGPYLTAWPTNPFCDDNVAANVSVGARAQSRRNGRSGWYYDRNTCMIYANSTTGGEAFDPQ